MGKNIKHTGHEMSQRWQQRMPRFFHRLMVLAIGTGITAAAVNFGVPAFGASLAPWWPEAYGYIIGCSIGVAIASKFTCDGGFREKSISQFTSRTVPGKDDV